jgi:hypothetical protein
MARSPYGAALAHFEAQIHNSKNRQVSIPADMQRSLGLERRPDNHIILVSIRRRGEGRWNHHYFKLTFDNEFSIPADVGQLRPGDPIEVKVHRVIADIPVQRSGASGAATLAALAARPRPGWREDGSERLDEYLRDEA